MVCVWGFIGAFCGLSTILAIFGHTDYFKSRAVPPIVASFGASAILCYGAIDVPLAQPRSLVFGHFFSGLIGVIIATIFQFDLEAEPFPRLQWLAASLATAIALVVMHLTKTTHPPAGATALLPCVDPHVWALRWYYLPVLLLSSAVVLVSAVLLMNLQRQYPKFWVAQIPPPPPATEKEKTLEEKKSEGSEGSSARDTLQDMERGPL
jgi:CBS-domain-containing membrane protein